MTLMRPPRAREVGVPSVLGEVQTPTPTPTPSADRMPPRPDPGRYSVRRVGSRWCAQAAHIERTHLVDTWVEALRYVLVRISRRLVADALDEAACNPGEAAAIPAIWLLRSQPGSLRSTYEQRLDLILAAAQARRLDVDIAYEREDDPVDDCFYVWVLPPDEGDEVGDDNPPNHHETEEPEPCLV